MSAEGYAKALAAFQESLPNVSKGHTAQVKSDKGNYSYGYADLTDISAIVVPLLAKQGLAWSAKPTLTDAGFVLAYSLRHVEGHVESGEYPLPDPTKTAAQNLGSAITYARRYALTSITGVAPGGDDDDGAKAQEARSSVAQRPAPSPQSGDPELIKVKGRVWATAKEFGWDAAGLAKHYTDSTGETLAKASVADLENYEALLEAIAEDNKAPA